MPASLPSRQFDRSPSYACLASKLVPFHARMNGTSNIDATRQGRAAAVRQNGTRIAAKVERGRRDPTGEIKSKTTMNLCESEPQD